MLILFVTAVLMSGIIHPYILKISRLKGLVDNPGARKLQKEPVPVMGGVAVFFGIVVSLCFFKTTVSRVELFSTVCGMMIMLYLGTIDDILDVRAWKKFVVEIIVCTLITYGTRNLMANWGGWLGVDFLPVQFAIPFTIVAMVGIINSINLIDGVDGLSSGLSIFVFGVFSLFLFLAHEYSYSALAVIGAGALVPFFLHNVFGHDSKMYLGDGGALMIGVAISSLVLDIVKRKDFVYDEFIQAPDRICLAAFCLATLSVPVFDTLRVMTIRICHGIPPFAADREHLHHHLLDMGCTHIATSLIEIGLDAFAVLVWFAAYRLGADANLQMVITILAGLGPCLGLTIVRKKQ